MPIIAKTRSAKDVGKRKTDNAEFDADHRRPCFDQAQRAPKHMYDKQHGKAKGMDKPAWEPLNTTWPQKPEASVILKQHDIVGEKKSKDNGGKD